LIVCHSEDEEPFPFVACTHFFRAKEPARNAVAQAFKIIGDLCEAEAEVAGHVFEKHDCRFHFANDSTHVRPKVSRIILSTTFAAQAEGLTWIPRSERIHDATPRSAVEGAQIRPDRCRSQAARFHRRCQVLDGEGFPLHPTDCAKASQSQFQSEVETCSS
jgi:hypothetical protein